MRKLAAFLSASLLACAVFAAPHTFTFTAATGTNTTASSTTIKPEGYVDEITLELPSGALTGTVSVVATPPVGDAVILASNTITATTVVRPRFDGTDTAGAALTNDDPWRYLCINSAVQLTVTDANVTGKTWRAWFKYSDN